MLCGKDVIVFHANLFTHSINFDSNTLFYSGCPAITNMLALGRYFLLWLLSGVHLLCRPFRFAHHFFGVVWPQTKSVCLVWWSQPFSVDKTLDCGLLRIFITYFCCCLLKFFSSSRKNGAAAMSENHLGWNRCVYIKRWAAGQFLWINYRLQDSRQWASAERARSPALSAHFH